MNLNKPPIRKTRLRGLHFLSHGMRSISTGSKARFAIAEAKRFGAEGQELIYALMTIKHRVLMTGRNMRDGLTFQNLEALEQLNKATGVSRSTKTVLGKIDEERAAIRVRKKPSRREVPKEPSIVLRGLRKELANALRGLMDFGRDSNIRTRFNAFENLIKETRREECEQVCEWLEKMRDYYIARARTAKSYSQHADQADYALRCGGAAGALYGKHGFKGKELESQKQGYALLSRLGLA